MRSSCLWLLCGLSFTFALGAGQAAPVVLAAKGQAVATVVLPAHASDKEKLAAEDLRHYVQALCGVELPLRADGQAVAATGLYIGRCAPTRDSDFPAAGLNPETYALHVREGSVFFTGRYPTPTYFAVASFLEGSLGVRWFAPGELWEYVPAGKPGELTVEVKDVVSVPDTSPRVWSGHQWTPDWQRWCLRNKAVLGEVVPRRQFQNFLFRVFPPETYGQTHPEYYPLINGQRWIPPAGAGPYWRPCESNPEVQRLTVEYARRWFDDSQDRDSFSLGMDDISHLCSCPNCRGLDAHPDSYEKHEFSDRHYKFVNAIAREVAKTHPDRYIGTLIYSVARKLPETVDKLEPNVFGYITEESASWWDPQVKAADHELTRQWRQRATHLSRYDYFGMGGFTPRVYPHLMAEQLKFDKSLGLEGMYTEVYTFLPNTAPMMWAFARLQWDVRPNVDSLLGEFYGKMFGAAAPTMKQYFDLLEKSWTTARPGRTTAWVHRNVLAMAQAMSAEDVAAGFKLLSQARRQADSEAVRRRIAVVEAGLRYGSYPIRAYALSQQLARTAVSDEGSAQRALATAVEMGEITRERQAFWAAAPRRQDLLGDVVRGLSAMGYLETGKVTQVEGGALVAAAQALNWYEKHAPEKLPAVVADLSAKAKGSEVAALAQLKAQSGATGLTNLLRNGGFEDRSTNAGQAEKDWQTSNAPVGWSSWSTDNRARFGLEPTAGRSGAAVSMRGATSACYLQGVPVQPGERYLLQAWVKADPPTRAANATLAIRYNVKGGGWYPRTEVEPSLSAPANAAGWHPLLLMVTIPPDAVRLIVMLSARGQEADATALFDEVTLYQLPQ